MTPTLHVRPASPEVVVAFPGRPHTALDKAGEHVPDSTYWRRRLASGDVVLVSAPEAPARARAVPKDS